MVASQQLDDMLGSFEELEECDLGQELLLEVIINLCEVNDLQSPDLFLLIEYLINLTKVPA